MDLICASLPLPNKSHSQFLSPYFSTPFRTRYPIRPRRCNFIFTRKCLNLVSNGSRLQFLGFPTGPRSSKALQQRGVVDKSISEDFSVSNFVSLSIHDNKIDESMLNCIAKPVVYTLFCIAVGFVPFRTVKAPAIAAQVVADRVFDKKAYEEVESNLRGHEYSEFTRQLLEAVSYVSMSIEEARKGNCSVEQVEMALKTVKLYKVKLQEGILNYLHTQLRDLKREKVGLERRLEGVVNEVVEAKWEYERLVEKMGSSRKESKERMDRERMARLEQIMRMLEVEYNEIWERVGEIGDIIFRRETVALSFGVRELCFIERECDQLVKRFTREMRARGKDTNRYDRKLHFM